MSTTDGLDLHLSLSATRPARSLEEALRSAIVDGRLTPGTRLPAARTLAADLGISRNTVAGVYAQLTAEGWLVARVGAGSWVADQVPGAATATTSRTGAGSQRLIDMRGGIPDPTGFPRREWVAAVRSATLDAPVADLGYPDPAGTPRLRSALAGYLARTRGVRVAPDGVVVGQGFGDLLVLICRALRERGVTRVAVEEYGHEEHRLLIAATGLQVVPIPVDDEGADVTVLPGSGAGAVLLTPAHQYPVGVPLSTQRRRWLVGWAQRVDGLVLEDDYDGEFRYDRRSIGALQALAPDHVAYLGTASKAVSASIGLAWTVPPARLLAQVVTQRELSGGKPSGLHQLALAAFIEAHEYDRSVRRLRAQYLARRVRLAQVVADELPGCQLTGLAAGLQCLLRLRPGTDESAVVAAAGERGLRLEGLAGVRAAGAGGPAEPGLVIGYGGPTPGQFEQALSALVASVLAQESPRRLPQTRVPVSP